MSDTIAATGFSVPTFDDKPKATRRPRKKAEEKAASKLIEAIDFITQAADLKSPHSWQHFARFVNGWAYATNGVLRAGHPIEEDLTLCPHLGLLRAALAKTGASVSLTPQDTSKLTVAGGSARFIVPCASAESLPPSMGQPNIAPIDDRIKQGFAALLALAKDDAETIYEASLLLRANSVVGCNGTLAMEYWHGNDLPPALNIPQAFAKAVVNIPHKLAGFGWQEGRSVTFYFENGAWLATQLMDGQWPEAVDTLLNLTSEQRDVPKKLFEALDAIKDFSKDGAIHFHDDKLKTSYASMDEAGDTVYGATFDVPGLKGHHSFSAKLLKLAKPACATFDYTTYKDKVLFYNQDAWLRGVLTKRIG